MTDLRSKYLPAIFILSAGTLLLLSAWIFLENRHITQLEDTLRETRIELGRARLEAARSCEPDPSAGEPPLGPGSSRTVWALWMKYGPRAARR